MVGRTIVRKGPPVRDLLRGWCLEGSVSFGSSHCLCDFYICCVLSVSLDSKSLEIAMCSRLLFSNSGFHKVVNSVC